MSQPTQKISIRLEIDVPVGVEARVVGPEKRVRRLVAPTQTDPGAGATKPVRTSAAQALGSICAWARFDVEVFEVRAKVYNDPDAIIHEEPLNTFTLGVPQEGGRLWVWDDATGNALGGVNHSAAAPPENRFVVWSKPSSTATEYDDPHVVSFFGQTGTSGYCGTGSGPGLLGMQAATYPAFWAVEMSGFAGGEAAFNNLHALRGDRAAAVPTWENHGDGVASPRVEMRFSPQARRWTLAARLGKCVFTAEAVSASPFGPLVFPVGQTQAAATPAAAVRVVAVPI